MSEISLAFSRLNGRGALIAYLMGGDPSPSLCVEVIEAVVKGGADLLELGIPFSDPIADGRAIQAAGERALRAGIRPPDVVALAKEAKLRHGVPLALMSYYNLLFARGPALFLEEARLAGVDGLIVPDLPLEEAGPLLRAAKRRGLDLILLATPETPKERLLRIARSTSGFLYLVSLRGVTGARPRLSPGVSRLIANVKRYLGNGPPLAVGFGLSRPEHIGAVLRAGADGAIVGGALVELVARIASGEASLSSLTGFVARLKEATRVTRRPPSL
ncbi:MAG: tryptophan synthase subunit alpha [Nitrososphaerota archaeon]